uniref:Uncharacterized protein n=1 Tax=Ciona intestinalis TaxID=7719 RepID=H2XMP7_CIOIN
MYSALDLFEGVYLLMHHMCVWCIRGRPCYNLKVSMWCINTPYEFGV